VDDVGAGLLIVLEFNEAAVLGFEKQLVEGAETVSSLVEPGVLALDRLLNE
jgi:hypothetical protein